MEKEFDITGLSPDGRGVAAKKEGEPVTFVEGALPGERVVAEVQFSKRNFSEARCLRVLSPSPKGVTPPCPHAGTCGGCPLMRMEYESQLFWKKDIVQNALRRIGGMPDAPVEEVKASPLLEGFRNKIELAFGVDDAGNICLGMRKRYSRQVERTPSCILPEAMASKLIPTIEALSKTSGLGVFDSEQARSKGKNCGYLRFCLLRTGFVPKQEGKRAVWVTFITSKGSKSENATLERLAQELLEKNRDIHAVVHDERSKNDGICSGDRRVFAFGRDGQDTGASRIEESLFGKNYEMDCNDFFQVNIRTASMLAELARQGLGKEPLLDLYCGVGAPGLSCVDGELVGLEYSKSSVASAKANAKRFGIEASYMAGDAAKNIAKVMKEGGFSQILCDPPRAGLAPEVVAQILLRAPRRIVYISCNPATLARDIKSLSERYQLERLTPVDMFPHTAHVESVAILGLKKAF